MEPKRCGITILGSLLLFFCMAATCYGIVLFSSLSRTLEVTASFKQGQVLKAGVDKITLTWGLNQSLAAGTDSAYKTIKVKLCYSPVSQVDRAWRKTVDNLAKDKTCQFKIVSRPYDKRNQTFEWTVERDVPSGTYFIRAYAYNSDDVEVAYGQTTDAKKTTNLFDVQAISGRHASLDIASVCFSAFAVLSLLGFFIAEKRRAKLSERK
ncbi:high-affinity nitrate transporter 3.2-like [Juglans microcarpa x Juglans regia]|uniref:high-affinity nitrate transporter 3.2-like n=1 Tax=Juglans microcarpa x Juglans regia TaxID=2249226 RepID=UPI001B7E4184|nr:high-affinity nitrate transporter 3.2-like [Juglans microcarpa x Juglans regia]